MRIDLRKPIDRANPRLFIGKGREQDRAWFVASLPTEPFRSVLSTNAALHQLDPIFREATLENEALKAIVRDLKFHANPRLVLPLFDCGGICYDLGQVCYKA